MPTAVKPVPELRAIGLHEEKKPSLLYSKSRPAPSPAVRPASLNTPPPEYTLPPPPTYNYSDTVFDHKTPGGSRTASSSENGSRRGSRAMGSISGKGMLINPGLSRAKLVDCASKLTCLFWFENPFVLHRVSECPQITVYEPLSQYSKPTDEYKQWMSNMISTTQISQNVVFMALLFIYRLKMLNPSVKGNPGSEKRLFTVAVMLGNKFLDDNTYTNKTWAEVSRINVNDIHVMEVEFLSNMKYNLYTSLEQWTEWETKLSKFCKYWDAASSITEQPPQALYAPIPRSTLPIIHTHLPSPPLTEALHQSPSAYSMIDSAPVSPLSARPPLQPPYRQTAEQLPHRGHCNVYEPVRSMHSKKRSYDGDEYREQQTKRVALGQMQQAPIRQPPQQQTYYHQPSYAYGENYNSGIIPPLQLEPPVLCATSYQVLPQPQLFPTSSVVGSILPSSGPSYPSYPTSYTRSNSWSLAPQSSTRGSHNIQIPSFGTNVSPVSYSAVPSAQVSPLTNNYKSRQVQTYVQVPARTQCQSQATLQPTPQMSYPSQFGAIDRLSPYRPVRGVNTLASDLPAPLSPTPTHHYPESMQYYPLAKTRSTRSGSAYCQDYTQFPGYSYQALEAN